MASPFLPDVYFGRAGVTANGIDVGDTDDNDEEIDTPEDVVEILGFDPAEFDDDTAQDDELSPEDDDEELLSGYPIVDEEPEEGSEEYRNAIQCDSWVAADDIEWEESKHPRDKSGQFTKGSGFASSSKKTIIANTLKKVLTGYGYKKTGMSSGGHHVFEHAGGHKVHVGPSLPEQEYVAGFRLSGNGQHGAGAGALAKHLESLHSNQPIPDPVKPAMAAAPLSQAKPEPKTVVPQKDIAHKSQIVNNKLAEKGFTPSSEDEGFVHFKDEQGNTASVAKKYSPQLEGYQWQYSSADKGVYITGSKFGGPKGLTAQVDKLKNAPIKEEIIPPTKGKLETPKGLSKILPESKETQDSQGNKVEVFWDKAESGSAEEVLSLGSNGSWVLWTKEGGIEKGEGQESLNAAFEALHPRDEHGHFIKKAGEEEPTEFKSKPGTEEFTNELNKLDDAGWEVSYKGTAATTYVDFTGATINVANEKDNWELTNTSGNVIAHGDDLTSLYSKLKDAGEYGRSKEEEKLVITLQLHPDPDWNNALNQLNVTPVTDKKSFPDIKKFKLPSGKLLQLNTSNDYWELDTDEGPVANHGLKSLLKKIDLKTSASTPKTAVGNPVEFSSLKNVGPQLGSNPGGQYEDDNGNKYYVKQVKSNDHANNELLAAELFAAAGGNTFSYHPIKDGDKIYVGTDWQPLKKNNLDQLSPEEKKQTQKDFALHAWLANWDAAGLTGDNVGVTPDGKVIPLDFGGSLKYRAQGGDKSHLFTNEVGEWDSLRTGYKNPAAVKLYGDMTPQQLAESVKQLDNISQSKINELVDKYGPNDDYEKAQLKHRLAQRKLDLTKKAAAYLVEANKPKEPHAPAKSLLQAGPGDANYDPAAARTKIAEWNPPNRPGSALSAYKGSDYQEMNALMRFGALEDSDTENPAQYIRDITKWLDNASSKEDMIIYRGVPEDTVDQWKKFAKVGKPLLDDGFMSMSTSKSFSDSWQKNRSPGGRGITLKITIPKGAKIGTVYSDHQPDSEYEVISQRGTVLRINVWPTKKTYGELDHSKMVEVTMEQSHMGHEGKK